ncbi:zinc ribbon domain-containing protein [Desulfovibrio inopinatus]|uniref:zinc ribbon domain-containing protein n=1 Tax=Desulfovibrio inopinatus TaxID=102109 RepID=UPI00048233F4|nr:zinc ribbon domain-containing protein [Desulfovibrio inopinatus]
MTRSAQTQTCSTCHAVNVGGQSFCLLCKAPLPPLSFDGAPTVPSCPACGKRLKKPNAKFCPSCGAKGPFRGAFDPEKMRRIADRLSPYKRQARPLGDEAGLQFIAMQRPETKLSESSAKTSSGSADFRFDSKPDTQAAGQQTRPSVCPSCGKALKPGAKFCGGCGAPLQHPVTAADPTACPYCGKQIKPGVRFCGGCGHKVSD